VSCCVSVNQKITAADKKCVLQSIGVYGLLRNDTYLEPIINRKPDMICSKAIELRAQLIYGAYNWSTNVPWSKRDEVLKGRYRELATKELKNEEKLKDEDRDEPIS
jgi:hypothetical protein